jgi:hypothetical protein
MTQAANEVSSSTETIEQRDDLEGFYDVARKLGHHEAELRAGREVGEIQFVKSLEELKRKFRDGSSVDERKKRLKDLRNHESSEFTKTAKGVLAVTVRTLAYVFADFELGEDDKEQLAPLFPMAVRAISVKNKTLRPGEVWDLGTSTSPQNINVGTLTMESGSSIVIRNTPLELTIQNLVLNSGNTPGPNYHLAILGAPGRNGETGRPGDPGQTGITGRDGVCEGTKDGGPGGDGMDGMDGMTGARGTNGLPALTATITIEDQIQGNKFVVLTRSGDGGNGGRGGSGGRGGDGGRGGGADKCGCNCGTPGNGGNGGDGGKGANGGNGGDGTKGMHIYLKVPEGQKGRVTAIQEDSRPGNGGLAGGGGSAGDGGRDGGSWSHGDCRDGGSRGQRGKSGISGVDGPASTTVGTAGTIYINEIF